MTSPARSVNEYLESLSAERREAITAVLETIRQNIDPGFEEGMQYGMIGFYVPFSTFPAGYHCDPKQPLGFLNLASQKNFMSLYLMCIYTNSEINDWFVEEYRKSGKKLDMGKSCIRFKTLDHLPLDVVGALLRKVTLASYVARYEAFLATQKTRKK